MPVKREETAPFHENEITEDINLFDILPLFRINQGDGGYYLDKACVISRDLEDPDNFGKQNVGIYRMQVKGKDRLGIQPVPQRRYCDPSAPSRRTRHQSSGHHCARL